MKSKFIKLFMLPVAAFFLASAAAVTTDKSHESKTTTSIMGYIHNPSENDCESVSLVDCVAGTGDPCVFGSWTVYGSTGLGCSLQLKRE